MGRKGMNKGGVSRCDLAISIKKKYLKKAKEEEKLWILKYNFTIQKYD
jgi:hypothetical protein